MWVKKCSRWEGLEAKHRTTASYRRGARGAHVGPMVFPDPRNRNLTKCLKQQQQQALTVHLSFEMGGWGGDGGERGRHSICPSRLLLASILLAYLCSWCLMISIWLLHHTIMRHHPEQGHFSLRVLFPSSLTCWKNANEVLGVQFKYLASTKS